MKEPGPMQAALVRPLWESTCRLSGASSKNRIHWNIVNLDAGSAGSYTFKRAAPPSTEPVHGSEKNILHETQFIATFSRRLRLIT